MRSKGDIDIARRGQGIRRRRTQERRGLHGQPAPSTRSGRRLRRESRTRHRQEPARWTACCSSTSRPARPPTTSSRACAAARRDAHRPYRHARSDRDRPSAARRRPRHAARALSERVDANATTPTIRLGSRPTPYDSAGRRVGRPDGPVRSRARRIDRGARRVPRARFVQQPPAFSAKKIDGQRSYKLARAARQGLTADDAG